MTVGLVLAPTDEQAMLLDASASFMDAALPLATIRKRADGPPSGPETDADYRRAAGDLGWFGMLVDEEHGGGSVSGNGVLDAVMLAAERGARLHPGPFAGHAVVVHALSTASAATHAELLSELVGGSRWATWAFDERMPCSLRAADGGLQLDGTVDVVADGGACGWFLVTADGPKGRTQVLVPPDASGVTVRSLDGLDLTRSWCALELDGVRVAPGDIVGEPGPPTELQVDRQAQLAAALSSAESVGAMHADFELALQYAKDRIAFGRPIGSFQAIKHLLADTSLWLEMAKGIVTAAATALGSEAPDGPALAHTAKAFVAERGVELAHNCFQVFGGIGYTWAHDQHLYLRRLAADAVTFGSATWHREQLLVAEGVGQ